MHLVKDIDIYSQTHVKLMGLLFQCLFVCLKDIVFFFFSLRNRGYCLWSFFFSFFLFFFLSLPFESKVDNHFAASDSDDYASCRVYYSSVYLCA